MRKTFKGSLLLAGVLAMTMGAGLAAQAETLRVKITNLTQGQVFSPPIVIAHPRNVAAFKLGEAASEGLAALAEGGDSSQLESDVMALGADSATATDGIAPGGTAIINIVTTGNNRRISVLGMLVSTNDAFFALDSAKPTGRVSGYFATAYDAGSEVNNEDCAFVPGPPCGGGSRDTEGAEGYVYVHSGIHGIAGLDAATQDWANPVAKIQIIRRDTEK